MAQATPDYAALAEQARQGGLIMPGNIDLFNRPKVKNPDGTTSTVRSMSFGADGNEILIPTVSDDGTRVLADDEAIAQYQRTKKHLGIFKDPASATAYAQKLHDEYAAGKYEQPDYAALAEQARAGEKKKEIKEPVTAEQRLAEMRARRAKTKANEPLRDAAIGAIRGGVSTVQSLASPIRKAFGMAPATPPPEETTTAGKVGRGIEQAAEFYGVAGAVSKAARGLKLGQLLASRGIPLAGAAAADIALESAGQAGSASALALAQGATEKEANTVGAISGIAPVVTKVMGLVAPLIREKALKQLSRVFATGLENKGPMVDYAIKTGTAGTPDVAKAAEIVRQAASDTLDLPIRASWGKWQTLLAKDTATKGQTLEAALKSTQLGQIQIPKADIVQSLDALIDESARHLAQVSKGGFQQIVYDQPLFKEIEALKETVGQYHDTITVQNLVDLKRVWDKAVYSLSTVGKVGVSPDVLVSTAMKEAMFTGANGIRQALETGAPEIARLNEAVSHAIQLQDLVAKLYKVNPAIAAGPRHLLTAAGAGVGAAIAPGGYAGHVIGASLGASTMRLLTSAMETPAWQTLKPFAKDRLAKALASGDADTVRKIIVPIIGATVTAKSKPPASPQP